MLISIVAILFLLAQDPHQHLLLFVVVFKDGHLGWDETDSESVVLIFVYLVVVATEYFFIYLLGIVLHH